MIDLEINENEWCLRTFAHYMPFFKKVMVRLGHHNWLMVMRAGNDNYCWRKSKEITIGVDYDGDIRQIILHEIAHIDTARFCNQGHNPSFWKRLEYLCWKFLGQQLDESQQRHKQWQSEGYYGIRYRNW